MKNAVCINADNALIINKKNKDGSTEQHPNKALLQSLKLSGHRDLYLFTNTTLIDIASGIHDDNKITIPALVNYLTQQGFVVHAVITPAEPKYKMDSKKNINLGDAFRNIYDEAYKKALNRTLYAQEADKYSKYYDGSAIKERYKSKPSAGRSHAMFNYFLNNKPDDLTDILYIDADKDKIEAIVDAKLEMHKKAKTLQLTTCQVHPQNLQNGVIGANINHELKNYNDAIEQFNPLSVKKKIVNVFEIYKIYALNTTSFFHNHGEAGRERVVKFYNDVDATNSIQEINTKLISYLENSKNGNTYPHSYRTMLLTTLLSYPLNDKQLSYVSEHFNELLNSFKASKAFDVAAVEDEYVAELEV